MVALSCLLAYDAFTSYISPYLTVTQISRNSANYLNQDIQVLGIITNGSVAFENNLIIFNLHDEESNIEVKYSGSPPQNLQEGGEVVVIGTLSSPNTIEALEMLIKCPSKYEGEEESLLSDPVFMAAILLGSGTLVATVLSVGLQRKKNRTADNQ